MLQDTIQQFLKEGKVKEADLLTLLEKNGDKVDKATPSQDMREHWDIKVVSEVKIDVKGLKKSQRSDQEPNENIHWIEIKNVQGKTGWAYAPEVDVFAFETIDYWVIVKKERLHELVSDKCGDKLKAESARDALYKLYTRSGRQDLMTQVKTLDLCCYAEKILKK